MIIRELIDSGINEVRKKLEFNDYEESDLLDTYYELSQGRPGDSMTDIQERLYVFSVKAVQFQRLSDNPEGLLNTLKKKFNGSIERYAWDNLRWSGWNGWSTFYDLGMTSSPSPSETVKVVLWYGSSEDRTAEIEGRLGSDYFCCREYSTSSQEETLTDIKNLIKSDSNLREFLQQIPSGIEEVEIKREGIKHIKLIYEFDLSNKIYYRPDHIVKRGGFIRLWRSGK